MSYLDDLSYRTIVDGYDNSLPVRKSLKFLGATIQDDELNDRTIVGTSGQLFTITLSEVLSNGNSAGNSKITNLGTPVFSADAVNKVYVDNSISSIGLDDVLAVSNVATSDINMSDHKITSLGNCTDGYDAANKNYVDEQISLKDHGTLTGLADDDHTQYLLVNGTRSMSGDLNMDSYNITNVATPLDGYDAANKNYVDSYTTLPETVIIDEAAGRRVGRFNSTVSTSGIKTYAKAASGADYCGLASLDHLLSVTNGGLKLLTTGAVRGDKFSLRVVVSAGLTFTVYNSVDDVLITIKTTTGRNETWTFDFIFNTDWILWRSEAIDPTVGRFDSTVSTSGIKTYAKAASGADYCALAKLDHLLAVASGGLKLLTTGAVRGDEFSLHVTVNTGLTFTVYDSLDDVLVTAESDETWTFDFVFNTDWMLWRKVNMTVGL